VNKPFINKSLYLQEIPDIGGWGVYTSVDISAEETIEISPIIVYPQSLLNIGIYMAMAEGLKPADVMLDQYGVHWKEDKLAIMLGYLSMYNHSSNPNARLFTDYTDRLMGLIASCDIKAGEQITVSYGPNWFEQKKEYLTYKEF
jgi:hypothetical protein